MTGRHRPARTPELGRLSSRLLAKVAAGLVVIGLVAGAVAFWPGAAPTTLSADFTRAVGLYPGSDVRVLGVRVGQVDAVEPQGEQVRVTFTVDARHRIPADAKAAIVAPSLVSDRYIQLLPVWTSGPAMADGTRIPLSRTAVPVELDRVSQSLDDLMVALGPDGANQDGALSALLETSAANLDGNGARFNETVRDLSAAVTTLSDHRGDFFGTVKNLQTFTTMLADNNAAVRRLNSDLATVALQLREERDNLQGALESLGVALDEVSSFVKDNRALIKADVDGLVSVTSSLVKQRQALAETLENAPVALTNLSHAYHPETGTLDTRNNTKGLDDPLLLLCSILTGPTRTGNTKLCDGLKDAVEPRLPQLSSVPEGSVLRGEPQPSGLVDIREADPTLGGLLGGLLGGDR
ncbi:MCE family protein [Intrasporangium calvum]|uniref:MCE family protein n=1 Tax=Intrasporangium calvum TaxID=53358 RepID=A0ABT5GJR3_9MICO|nr:MCE family protein [Intrasporangium calvum]MDC5698246.1 MCE family protein [Intrasporangium calvum]